MGLLPDGACVARLTSGARRALAVSAIIGSSTAWAISPATNSQIICAADLVVEAIVTATRGTCTTDGSSTTCRGSGDGLFLDVTIDRVVARKEITTPPTPERRIAVDSVVHDVYVGGLESSGGEGTTWRTIPFIRSGSSVANPPKTPGELAARSDELKRLGDATWLGRRFVFALHLPRTATSSTFAHVWELDGESEVVNLLAKGSLGPCPKLIEPARDD